MDEVTRAQRILVVDDEQDMQVLLTLKFRNEIRSKLYDFYFAQNGVEAINMIKQRDFDLVLTDINMPEMDGLTLLGRIREVNPVLKTIVVSAYGDMENIRMAMNYGAFDFITKPIDFIDLQTTMKKTLREMEIIRNGMEAARNLSEARKKQEEAEMQKDKAEQATRFKQQFLANMSHEIRTPLNAVIGLSNLLSKSPLNDQQQKYLSAVKETSQNLMHIVNDILDFSKIDAGKVKIEQVDFSLHQLMSTFYHTMRYSAEEKGLELIVTVLEDVPDAVIGDPVRINQILMNLTGNAIKFTDTGKVELEVSRAKNIAANNFVPVRFRISDTGIGIEPEKLDSIFESFTQAASDTTRKYGGTGLGLSITKQLVELQDGVMSVESRPGTGTTFTFELPLQAGNLNHIHKQKDIPVDAEDITLFSSCPILVAEDNPFNQTVAIDTLQQLIPGVLVTLASNGTEVIDILNNGKFGIVLMDIQMPGMDGYQATKIIRSMPDKSIASIPILAMTANATEVEMEKCYEAGMNDIITKPFEPEELLRKIQKLVGNRKAATV